MTTPSIHPKNGNFKDRTDQRFGRLVAKFPVGVKRESYIWHCECDCGGTKDVRSDALVGGRTQSCGCLHSYVVDTHGETGTPYYRVWTGMRNRCVNPDNPAWAYYGARGIKVCERWDSFQAFREDMGPRPSSRHSIDRIDNDGDYEPSNCKWSTPREQQNNRRVNRSITYLGETMTLAQWARCLGMGVQTLRLRLERGWSVSRALTEPVRK